MSRAPDELGPGDALYLPKLWWHQVEALAPFNGLVNYSWDAFATGRDAPYTSLLLAMITIAKRPPAARRRRSRYRQRLSTGSAAR